MISSDDTILRRAGALESIAIDAGGVRVHALARDGERPIVFVHGLAASSAYFADAGARPELDGRGIVAIDLPGFGRSPAPDGFTYAMGEQAAVLVSAIAALGLERVTLVGHSMGGTISILAVPAIRDRLERLVLAEGVFERDSELWSERIAAMPPDAWAREFDEIVKRPEVYARGGMLRRRKEAIRQIAPAITETTAHAMRASAIALQEATERERFYERFLALDLPRVYVFGAIHDTTRIYTRMLADGAPTAVVPRAGHLMMLDNPDAFYSLLES